MQAPPHSSASVRPRPTTCLSADPHDEDFIIDKLSHYMGCIEFCDREGYYEQLPSEGKRQIRTELRRIKYLRQVLHTSDAEKHLVNNVTNSLAAWKTENPVNKLEEVRKWSDQKSAKRKNYREHDPEAGARRSSQLNLSRPEDYNPDKDTNAYVIQYQNGEGVTDEAKRPGGGDIFWGKFPNQKISVDSLLRDREINPLGKDRSSKNYHETVGPGEDRREDRVRYFHLPTNNMKVWDTLSRQFNGLC